MKFKRIISTVLAVLMLMSAFTLAMSAEEKTDGTVQTAQKKTDSSRPTIDYFTGQSLKESKNEKKETVYELADLAYHAMVLMVHLFSIYQILF